MATDDEHSLLKAIAIRDDIDQSSLEREPRTRPRTGSDGHRPAMRTAPESALAAFGQVLLSNGGSARSFDIVLMDLSLPGVSGFSATRSIRCIEDAFNIGRQAHIVALTSLVSSKDRSAAYEAGVGDYITKAAGLKIVQGVIDTWRDKKSIRWLFAKAKCGSIYNT